jgi:Mn-dependent DtxR family transcriptional regulator
MHGEDMTINDQELMQAIYRRSHALRQNNASLDEVAADLGMHPSVLLRECRSLQEKRLITVRARFIQLTPAGVPS